MSWDPVTVVRAGLAVYLLVVFVFAVGLAWEGRRR